MTHTNSLVDADILIRNRSTGKETHLSVKDIKCLWGDRYISRESAEYWAVVDWLAETFGNRIDRFRIKSWTGSPVKEGKD
jgi:3-methyladenine DNA glycosylase AlkD